MPIIDLESNTSIKELYRDSKNGTRDINPTAYFQRFALNTSLTLNYGLRIEGNVNDELLHEIVDVERGVSNFRSTSNNWQDYIPLLRIFPKMNHEAVEFRARRDKYLTHLLDMLKDRIAKGTDKPCITGNILKDPEAKLNEGKITPQNITPSLNCKLTHIPAEVKSICLTMVSAGLDTVPGNLIMGIAYLASEDGQRIQKKAYDEIMAVYPDGDAWEKCLVEEKVPYVTALVKEILRFWTVIPICLPRESTKDIVWQGATIPAGTTFFMVSTVSKSYPFDLLLTVLRTPMLPITTKTTSRMPPNSFLSATSRSAKVPVPPITATEPVLGCVLARTWPTANSSLLSSA